MILAILAVQAVSAALFITHIAVFALSSLWSVAKLQKAPGSSNFQCS